MKNITRILTLTVAISLGMFSIINAQSNKAVDHMQEVNTPFVEMKTEIWQYLKAITTGKSARKVEKKRKKLLDQLRSAAKTMRSMKGFEGDVTLKESAMKYLDLSSTVLNEEYSKILDMEAISEQSYDNMEAYLLAKEKASEKLEAANGVFQDSYEAFASKNNVTIQDAKEDELTKKIRNANEALKYYNNVYLLFFKVYKQEMYVLDALGRNDVSGLQQNINSFKNFSKEGLVRLDTISAFKGSNALIVAAKYIIKFYKAEADKDFPKMVEFYLDQDKMNKMQKDMEGMRDSERTQEFVDRYNKASQSFNEAVAKFNQDNNNLNNKRAEYLNKWNMAVSKFFERHN
ncbi:MAG: hypothetical protein JKX84_01880 [Flavobacteriales bacterium]|nr:hypothetical protein [Flavobacteriales bacterium]